MSLLDPEVIAARFVDEHKDEDMKSASFYGEYKNFMHEMYGVDAERFILPRSRFLEITDGNRVIYQNRSGTVTVAKLGFTGHVVFILDTDPETKQRRDAFLQLSKRKSGDIFARITTVEGCLSQTKIVSSRDTPVDTVHERAREFAEKMFDIPRTEIDAILFDTPSFY